MYEKRFPDFTTIFDLDDLYDVIWGRCLAWNLEKPTFIQTVASNEGIYQKKSVDTTITNEIVKKCQNLLYYKDNELEHGNGNHWRDNQIVVGGL